MSFLALKVLKLGYSQAKKHRAKKQQEQFQQDHPMTEYPPGMAPGANVHYPPPASAPAPAEPSSKSSKLASMLISAIRFLQFVLGLTVIGLYGRDIHHNDKEQSWHAKCYFALTAAGLATITAVMYLLVPHCLRRTSSASNHAVIFPQFGWEVVLCILWLTIFGMFGRLFIGVYPASESGSHKRDGSSSSSASASSSSSGNTGSSSTAAPVNAEMIDRMRHAVWVDLVNLVLWVITASWILLRWFKGKQAAGSARGAAEKV